MLSILNTMGRNINEMDKPIRPINSKKRTQSHSKHKIKAGRIPTGILRKI